MKKIIPVLMAVSLPVSAADDCVLQDRTVSQTQVVVAERSPIRKSVVPNLPSGKKCIVDFRVRIGADWHTAFGEYAWLGDRPESEACAIAVDRAEDSVRSRVGKSQTVSEKILVCKDEPALKSFPAAQVGTVGDVGQFRPHPKYTERFYHNGTQCKWFLDTNFVGKDVKTFQGIICQLDAARWVVVDKF